MSDQPFDEPEPDEIEDVPATPADQIPSDPPPPESPQDDE